MTTLLITHLDPARNLVKSTQATAADVITQHGGAMADAGRVGGDVEMMLVRWASAHNVIITRGGWRALIH